VYQVGNEIKRIGPSSPNYVYELTSLSLLSLYNKGVASWMKTAKSGIGITPN
jgi:hypothetical protein